MSPLHVLLACAALLQSPDSGELKETPSGSLSTQQSSWLEQLRTAPPPEWMTAAESLATKANSAVIEELVALTRQKQEELRARAGFVLAKARSKESLTAAVQLALTDKSVEVRKTVASYLLSDAAGLLTKAGLLEETRKGLADKNEDVRFAFAMILAKSGDKDATPILKAMLKHSDHHRREAAAESLAELGDDSGAAVLIKMLEYTEKNHPLLIANGEMKKDKNSWDRLLKLIDEERIRVCGHVAKLKITKAKSALEKLSASPNAPVAEAARTALAALEAG